MANLKLRSKQLKKLGYTDNTIISIALNTMRKHHKHTSKDEVLKILKAILDNPKDFIKDPILSKIANEFIPSEEELKETKQHSLNDQPRLYQTFGKANIDRIAKEQMNIAMQLPITMGGALMPDAHAGYGLPIGGVLATKNAIIPYAVGVDIACRMSLTLYDLRPNYIKDYHYDIKEALKAQTCFGKNVHKSTPDIAVLNRPEWREVKSLRPLLEKAARQLGSSGGGNHFVEFGIVRLSDENNEFNLPIGDYVGLLSHSGSRGMGANIAMQYTKIAKEKCRLTRHAQQLAWLDLNSQEGQEYWLAMNLAGDYAAACHRDIHRRLSQTLGIRPIANVENHHNFAWKENLADGSDVIVHRKGATPAGKGVLGIIPGSMTTNGYIVRGKGNALAVNSASHGAGRAMSRSKAKSTFTRKDLRQHVKKHGVTLIGGGADEIPMAYKNIDMVMSHQQDLVDVIGTFQPKIVRMEQ